MKAVELFSGAGGLTLGISRAGFLPVAILEKNDDAMNTLLLNQKIGLYISKKSSLIRSDVRHCKYKIFGGDITLLAGGPPCQPFSQAGKHRGHRDERNMFPEMLRAVRELEPQIVLIENVRGLVREAFKDYFNYVLLGLRLPFVNKKSSESWRDHFKRLRAVEKRSKTRDLTYDVQFKVLNAADYGVPQKRERLFIVATRSDLQLKWTFPKPTHSVDALVWDQWVSKSYWKRHEISPRKIPSYHSRFTGKIERLHRMGKPETLAWQTVRDALVGLPPPHRRRTVNSIPNHDFYPGARSYPGHTGSIFDLPAKTLKAGNHGVPGGENMLALPNGTVRYFTIRECARLQNFPDDYEFSGAWCASVRQLGNAVPVNFAFAIANSIAQALHQNIKLKSARKLSPSRELSKSRAIREHASVGCA